MPPSGDLTPATWARIRALFGALGDLEPAARERLLAAEPDRELARAVAELFAAEADAGSLLESRTALAPESLSDEVDLAAGSNLGPWRIGGVLGQGGMGTVYRASRADGTFEREVAIKLVRGAVDVGALQRRFEAERRILATLEHPGIAKLLDAGNTTGGLPYLVLELVEGEPLDAYCRSHELGVAARLTLFIAICDAVAFAHEKLVLHRDLKPSNVLVDQAGQPKLLDFGIAKVLDPETGAEHAATLTRLGMRAMTPAYASPEQLRGEPLTTSSDVWSLGAVLFHLLTDRLPFADTLGTAEQRAALIESTSPEAPSAVLRSVGSNAPLPWRAVRGDLDTIVAKALAPDRSRRYRNAVELADDLRRLLEGRPVLARPDSLGYRARRFVRRHALAVAATTLVAIALITAAAIALDQARIARAERDLARSRFDEVRQLAGVFLFEVHDRVATLPGSLAARELLATTGTEYLDRLAAVASDDLDLAAEVAAGYARLAEIQGRPFGGHRGDTTAALASLEKALALRERLATQGYPSADEAAAALAETQLALAEVEFAVGRLQEAVAGTTRALETVAQSGNSGALLEGRIRARHGYLLAMGVDSKAGAAELERAIAILEPLANDGEAADVRFALARAHSDYGAVVGNSGEEGAFETALGILARALELDRALAVDFPDDPRVSRAVARSLRLVGSGLSVLYRDEEALSAFEESAALGHQLATIDPADAELQLALAAARLDAAAMLAALGRFEEAGTRVGEAIEVLERAHQREPDNIRVTVNLASALGTRAQVLWAQASATPGSAAAAIRAAACASLGQSALLFGGLLDRGLLIGTEADNGREAARRWEQHCRDLT